MASGRRTFSLIDMRADQDIRTIAALLSAATAAGIGLYLEGSLHIWKDLKSILNRTRSSKSFLNTSKSHKFFI